MTRTVQILALSAAACLLCAAGAPRARIGILVEPETVEDLRLSDDFLARANGPWEGAEAPDGNGTEAPCPDFELVIVDMSVQQELGGPEKGQGRRGGHPTGDPLSRLAVAASGGVRPASRRWTYSGFC